jgi:uncharacterized protein YndB with AHSA1/START domain
MRVSTSTVIINAPRDIVWAAVTLPENVRQWQFGSELSTDWIVGQPIRFRAEWQGQSFEQWGSVEEFTPPSRLRYSLFTPRPDVEDLPENYFTMTYELIDVDDGTRVRFIHEDPRGLDAEEESDDESSVLSALRTVAEILAKT